MDVKFDDMRMSAEVVVRIYIFLFWHLWQSPSVSYSLSGTCIQGDNYKLPKFMDE